MKTLPAAQRENRLRTVFLRAARKVNEDREAGLREREKLRRVSRRRCSVARLHFLLLTARVSLFSFLTIYYISLPGLSERGCAFPQMRIPSSRSLVLRIPNDTIPARNLNFREFHRASRVQDRTRVPAQAKALRCPLPRGIWRFYRALGRAVVAVESAGRGLRSSDYSSLFCFEI